MSKVSVRTGRATPGHVALAAVFAVVAALLMPVHRAHAANQITLTGSVAQNCTLNVTPDPNASALTLTDGATHVQVGVVLQNCNKKAGYTIVVSSANCGSGTAGAKLIGSAGGETLGYSVESVNPTTGGSSGDVTGLLLNTCATQNARTVTNAKINAENSTIFVNYTGNAGLGADTYTDTLTFTMNVN
jgi:hypothetical protein